MCVFNEFDFRFTFLSLCSSFSTLALFRSFDLAFCHTNIDTIARQFDLNIRNLKI